LAIGISPKSTNGSNSLSHIKHLGISIPFVIEKN